MLLAYFPDLLLHEELIEVFLLRNVVVHNHVWHLDVSDFLETASTIATPKEVGFSTNKHYEHFVDVTTRRTKKLFLHVNPTAVDRTDVAKVFAVVWRTLSFIQEKNYSDTPLAGRTVGYRGKRIQFEDLLTELQSGEATQPLSPPRER